MNRSNYSRIIREIKDALNDYNLSCDVDYQAPQSDGTLGLFMIWIHEDEWDWDDVNEALGNVMNEESLDWGDQEDDEDVTLLARSLLSTKNFDLAKCRLIDFIKGSKSMVFFAKYLIISSIVISNPLTSKIHIID